MEVFLLLALMHSENSRPTLKPDKRRGHDRSVNEFAETLSPDEKATFNDCFRVFDGKTDSQKQKWIRQIGRSIGQDHPLLDEMVHWTHVEAALNKEIGEIREIIVDSLPPVYRISFQRTKAGIFSRTR